MRFLVIVLSLFLFDSMNGFLSAAPVRSAHVEAELVSEQSFIQPGKAFQVALRLEMDEGWHTYYKDPGDAGLATSIVWDLPSGFHAGPISWPEPLEIREDILTVKGYEGEVFLSTRIEAPDTIKPGTDVVLRAHAAWLSCKDICLAGEADLVLELSVDKGAPVHQHTRDQNTGN